MGLSWVFLMKEKSETSSIYLSHSMQWSKHNSQPIYRSSALIGLEISLSLSWVITWYLKGLFIKVLALIHLNKMVSSNAKIAIFLRSLGPLLFSRNVHHHYWGDAILTVTYPINKMHFCVLKNPFQILLGSYPNSHLLHHIRMCIFGCTTFVHMHSYQRQSLILVVWGVYFLGTPLIRKDINVIPLSPENSTPPWM